LVQEAFLAIGVTVCVLGEYGSS